MTADPVFLTVNQVIEIHRRGIEQHGGTYELRDRGLLESAVATPAARFGGQYLHEGLPALAAAYLFHLCKNHAFVDGNKRVSIAVAEVFIELNAFRLAATDGELETLTLGVADGTISKREATQFFESHVKK
ncbi:MAG TPA: type II toxin-antitoxin system death-on-curing family toxin [Planctomycetaceae bacterium]|nr:type II toxin-antitoxin system death-on-curing family toxin [Planctomycetaceae bacterium]